MSNLISVTCAIAGATGLTLAMSFVPLQAVQMADGTVAFINPPSLGDMVTSNQTAGSLWATYRLTVVVPSDAGEPLERVTLASQGPDRVWFNLNQTQAYLGNNRKALIRLGNISQDRQTRQLTVTFTPPVPPGQAVTLRLQPNQNPLSGVYLFGVTAFPPGEKVAGQFLGYGRLHFYSPGELF
jgi:hypothetical protein